MPLNIVPDEAEETSGSDIVRSAIKISKISPEEAAQDISRANLLDVSPDTYSGMKDQLQPEAQAIERVPSEIQPQTEAFLRQSQTHLSLGGEDIDKMNMFERRMNYYKEQIIDIPEINRDINDIISKKMDAPGGVLEEGDQIALDGLREKVNGIQSTAKEYGINNDYGEELGVEVLSAGGDMIRQYTENLGIFAATVGAHAAIGAAVGSTVPVVGTIAGLTAGATEGAINGSMLVGFIDGYKQTSRSLFNELDVAKDEQGKDLNIPHDRKVNVSQAVGLIAGVAGGVAGKIFASSNPFLKKFINPKSAAKALTNPALLAKFDILGGIAKSVLAEGGEESLQEMVQIIGGNFAKMDESESSFTNAFQNTITDLEAWKQTGKAGLVGGLTGGLMQTVTSAPAYPGLKKRHEEIQQITAQKKEVLQNQNTMLELAQDMKEAKIAKVAPDEMKNWQKKILSAIGIDENVYVHLADLREFAKSPEKGVAIRKVINPEGDLEKLSQELDTPLPINRADLMAVVTEFPEITDHLRTTPDGENPLEVRKEAEELPKRMEDAEAKRTALKDSLGGQEATPEQMDQLRNELNATLGDSKYFTSRESYLGQSTVQPIDGIVNAKDAGDLSAAQNEARLAIDDSLVSVVDARFDRYADAEFRSETNDMIAAEVKKLQHEYTAIDNFTNTKDMNDTSKEVVGRHKKKGFSAFAIDPKSLPEDLKVLYGDHPELKKRKAFVEGGIDVEESAILNGFDSGADLLKALAETPTKKQIEQRVKADPLRNATRPDQIADSMEDTKLVARDEAFTKLTRAHLKEMDHMVKNNWPTMKRGIIKIAKAVPSVESLNVRAKETINTVKIGNLNPVMFAQGEKRTHKASIDHFVKGEIEQAFDLKEKAALNNEMRKEATKAQDRIARNQKFWKKASDASVRQDLKDAGMSDVMEEFMSLYKLDGNIKNEGEQKKFLAFLKRQVDSGNLDGIKIPERLTDTRASFKDLTVEQYQAMTDMGRFILKQAQLKNKLLQKKAINEELETQETIREDISETLQSHYDYDEKRAGKDERKTKDQQELEEVKNSAKTILSLFKNIDHIVFKLDAEKTDGLMYKLIGDPIARATTAEQAMNGEIVTRGKAIIEQFYGSTEKFQKMTHERVEIPEFKGFNKIGDGEGSVRKIDLLYMFAHLGDEHNRKQLLNFKDENGVNLDFDTMLNVFDQHLTVEDAKFVQNFYLNTFASLWQPRAELHKRTTGIDLEGVQATPIQFKGIELPGGYFPTKHSMLTAEEKAQMESESVANGPADEGRLYARLKNAEKTDQGRLNERTGSKRAIDLDYNNFFGFVSEIVHDLQFREVGIDTLKILQDSENAKNMKAIIGSTDFGVLLDSVKDVISNKDEGSPLFGKQFSKIESMINKTASLHAVQAIGFNVGSAAIQSDALNYLVLTAGPKAPLYIAKMAAKLTNDLGNYDSYVEQASRILPAIKLEQDAMDESLVKTAREWQPSGVTFFKNYNNLGKGVARLRILREKAVDLSFGMLREVDRGNKVIATLALTDQFLNGDHPDYDIATLNKMSPKEKVDTLKRVVRQTIDRTLTASSNKDKTPIEKMKFAKLLVNYWTDRRNRLNVFFAQGNKIRGAAKKGEYRKAAGHVLWFAFAAGSAKALNNAIKDEEESIFNRMDKVKDARTLGLMARDTAWDFAKAPIQQTMESIPVLDSALYTYDTFTTGKSRTLRPVTTPVFGVISEGVRGAIALKDLIEDGMSISRIPDKDRKAIINNLGYAIGGAPTNTINKAMDMLNEGTVRKGSRWLKEEIQNIHETFDKFIDAHKDVPEAQEMIEDVKTVKAQLPQFDADQKNMIPDNAKEEIKAALSGGDWKKYNKETGAAGVYQFTENQWSRIASSNPELGLTENGRVAKDSSQQEKAMEWEMADNSRNLLAYDLDVTSANLLGAHEFGFDTFVAIASSPDGDKLSDAIGEEAKRPELQKFKTVGEVRKYLSRQVRRS